MPGWTDHCNALTEKVMIEQEVFAEAQTFECKFSIPHFYPGLAEEELFVEREMRKTIEYGAQEELRRAGFIT